VRAQAHILCAQGLSPSRVTHSDKRIERVQPRFIGEFIDYLWSLIILTRYEFVMITGSVCKRAVKRLEKDRKDTEAQLAQVHNEEISNQPAPVRDSIQQYFQQIASDLQQSLQQTQQAWSKFNEFNQAQGDKHERSQEYARLNRKLAIGRS